MGSKTIKLGDKVFMDGITSIAQSACAYDRGSVVTDEKTKYNPYNGKPYKIVFAYDKWWNANDGTAVNNSMYYIYKK